MTILQDIFEFENLNLKYFEKDKYETIKYFEMAIRKLTKIREKLTFNYIKYDNYNDDLSYKTNINYEMSAQKMGSSKLTQSETDKTI